MSTTYYPGENPSTHANGKARLEMIETISNEDNTSTVVFNFQINPTTYGFNYNLAGSITIGDTTYVLSGNSPVAAPGQWTTVWSRTMTFSHDAAGAGSVVITFAGTTAAPSGATAYFIYNGNFISQYIPSGSYTLQFTQTQPASRFSTYTTQCETQGRWSCSVERVSTTYWHDVTFTYGSEILVRTGAFEVSTGFTVPRSWFNNIANNGTVTVNAALKTYSEQARTHQIGNAVNYDVVVSIDAGMKPTIVSCSLSADNSGTTQPTWTEFIQNHSKVRATVSATATTGTTIDHYSVIVDNQETAGTLSNNAPGYPGDVTVKVRAYDKRGLYAEHTSTITVWRYATPYIKTVSAKRCTSDGTLDDDGTYLKLNMVGYSYPVGERNTAVLTGTVDGDEIHNVHTLVIAQDYLAGGYDPDDAYTVTFTVSDQLGNSASRSVTLPTRIWAMQFHESGLGVAFGKSCEIANALQIPAGWDVYKGENKIGDTQAQSGSASVATGTGTAVGSITLTPGTYILECSALFGASANGYRILNCTSVSGSTARGPHWATVASFPVNTTLPMTVVQVVTVTSNTTYFCNCYQNSGGALTTSWSLRATRIL